MIGSLVCQQRGLSDGHSPHTAVESAAAVPSGVTVSALSEYCVSHCSCLVRGQDINAREAWISRSCGKVR